MYKVKFRFVFGDWQSELMEQVVEADSPFEALVLLSRELLYSFHWDTVQFETED